MTVRFTSLHTLLSLFIDLLLLVACQLCVLVHFLIHPDSSGTHCQKQGGNSPATNTPSLPAAYSYAAYVTMQYICYKSAVV